MTTTIDWDKVKFRASSWGNLMTEPVSKSDKEAGKLSATCQKELIKLYCQLKYGRKRDITTKHMNEAIGNEASGAMMQACTNHVLFAAKNGWDKYIEEMTKPEISDIKD